MPHTFVRYLAVSLPKVQNSLKIHPFASRFASSLKAASLPSFVSCDPYLLDGAKNPHHIHNLVGGKWVTSDKSSAVIDPLSGEKFIISPQTEGEELEAFVESMSAVPKSGRHNAFKNPERYLMYGQVLHRCAAELHKEEVFDFFIKCIQRTMPKSYAQAAGEVQIVRSFCENFGGDSLRFLVRGFIVPGDHIGQLSSGYRWPYGPVAVIAPFNFPLEIPAMQLLSAAMVGNKPLVKCHSSQGLVIEQFIRLLHHCGLPLDEIDLISIKGQSMPKLLKKAGIRMLQFTGSTAIAEKLIEVMEGRIRIEDSGFDWKILGPDKPTALELEYVAWQCDQDAFAISGQKCSAQSMLFAHTSWIEAGLLDKLKKLAATRSLRDLSSTPLLAHTSKEVQNHVNSLLSIPGATLIFGGNPIEKTQVPSCYGLFEPTAVFIPLQSILHSRKNFELATTELFGPVQVITEWKGGEENLLVSSCERMKSNLTAAIVSKDPQFLQYMLANTVNGTTYAGLRARTTGAPQNHWFGPGADAIGGGIGSPEAILHTWTCHREIVFDHGPIPEGWSTPPPT